MHYSLLGKILSVACFVGIAKAAAVPPEKVSAPAAPPTHWNYHDVKQWKENFLLCGDVGEHQSPINLDSSKAKIMNYTAFNFTNYDKIFPEMITNNGHTVMMKLDKDKDDDELPFITGGGLSDRYNFAQLHFHWGVDPLKGSEHHIDRLQFPAEVHLVHYNSKYGNFNDALPHPDGLAALGIMIELQFRDNPAFRHIEEFNAITAPDAAKSVNLPYSVPLSDLLPDDTGSFYRYNGSLTTPGCNEDVIWTIFDTPIAISERQLNIFKQLHDDEGHPLENNFRPIQELHNRTVTYRKSNANNNTFLDEEIEPYISIEIISL